MAPTPMPASLVSEALPHRLPEAMAARLLLLAIRRMGAHGLNDAVAANSANADVSPSSARFGG